jgi:hypothetical protein
LAGLAQVWRWRVSKQEHPFPIFLFCTGLALLVYFLAIW